MDKDTGTNSPMDKVMDMDIYIRDIRNYVLSR
jgi:hypothetical protein